MALTTAQTATLATELNSDPRGYGYAALITAGNDGGLVAKLNLLRDGTAGTVPTTPTAGGGIASGIITIKRADCAPNEILEAIDVRDFAATPTGTSNATLVGSWFESVAQFSRIRLLNADGSKTLTRKNIDRLVNDTQGSQTRLDAVAVRVGSRAEELFGASVTLTGNDISLALRGS